MHVILNDSYIFHTPFRLRLSLIIIIMITPQKINWCVLYNLGIIINHMLKSRTSFSFPVINPSSVSVLCTASGSGSASSSPAKDDRSIQNGCHSFSPIRWSALSVLLRSWGHQPGPLWIRSTPVIPEKPFEKKKFKDKNSSRLTIIPSN